MLITFSFLDFLVKFWFPLNVSFAKTLSYIHDISTLRLFSNLDCHYSEKHAAAFLQFDLPNIVCSFPVKQAPLSTQMNEIGSLLHQQMKLPSTTNEITINKWKSLSCRSSELIFFIKSAKSPMEMLINYLCCVFRSKQLKVKQNLL